MFSGIPRIPALPAIRSLLLTSVALVSLRVVAQAADRAELTVAAESSTMNWNAVAVVRGRIFVSGPRWSGSKGPSLALIDRHGVPQPYPDVEWNGWKVGADTRTGFVNVNAVHLDGKGSLWVVDSGAPDFGGDPLPGAAKLVQIDLATNSVKRVIALGPDLATAGSYIDDIRFNGTHAYLTDAGKPGLIVLELASGNARRVLNGHSSTTASADRPIVVGGKMLLAPDGEPMLVNSDPLELSPDRKWLYFAPLEGPWSKIETRWLDDSSATVEAIAAKVEPWTDLPPIGGSTMDSNGDLYFTDLATDALKRRASDGTITTIIQDARLHWVDAPFIDERRRIWLPVPQLDRVGLFNGGQSKIEWPIRLYTLQLPKVTKSGNSKSR